MENKAIIKLHIIFWIVVLSISVLNTFLYFGNALFVPLLISSLIGMFCNIITFYLFYFLISPAKFNKKGVFFLVLFGLFYLFISSFIFSFILYLPVAYSSSVDNLIEYTLSNGVYKYYFDVLAYLTMVSILGSLSKVSLIWYCKSNKTKGNRETKHIK